MIDTFAAAVESYRMAQLRFDAAAHIWCGPRGPNWIRGLYATAVPGSGEPFPGVCIVDEAAEVPARIVAAMWAPSRRLRAVDYCAHREATVPAEAVEVQERAARLSRERFASRKERKQRPTVGDKIAAGWRRRKAAAQRQREEERTMPRGQKLDESKILAALDTAGRTAKGIAEKLGVCEGPVSKRLRALAADGRAKQIGGGRGIGPAVWALDSSEDRAYSRRNEEAVKERKQEAQTKVRESHSREALAIADGGIDCWRISVNDMPLVVATSAAFERIVNARVAAALRTTADELVTKGVQP